MSVMHEKPVSDSRSDAAPLLPGLGASITLVGTLWTAVALQDVWGGSQNPVLPSDLHNHSDVLLVLGLLVTAVGIVISAAKNARSIGTTALGACHYLGLALLALSTVHATSVLWANFTGPATMGPDAWAWLFRYDGLLALAGALLVAVSQVLARVGRGSRPR